MLHDRQDSDFNILLAISSRIYKMLDLVKQGDYIYFNLSFIKMNSDKSYWFNQNIKIARKHDIFFVKHVYDRKHHLTKQSIMKIDKKMNELHHVIYEMRTWNISRINITQEKNNFVSL